MHARCHHPPFTMRVDPGRPVTMEQHATIERVAMRSVASPESPIVYVGESLEVVVDVIECSWCRRPFDHVDTQADIDARLAECLPCPTCGTGQIRRGDPCPICEARARLATPPDSA